MARNVTQSFGHFLCMLISNTTKIINKNTQKIRIIVFSLSLSHSPEIITSGIQIYIPSINSTDLKRKKKNKTFTSLEKNL